MDQENQEQRTESGQVPAPTNQGQGGLLESWRAVVEQIRELAVRFTTVFRTSWHEERPEEAEAVRNLGDDLRATADRLDRVLRRATSATEAERTQTAQVTRDAAERTLAEARPAVANALRSLNQQLEQLSRRLERDTDQGDSAPPRE